MSARKIWDIPGGIHPPENKAQSLASPIATLPLPAQLVLPLSQHIGAAAKPLVQPGDQVLKGQLLAEAVGFVSAPVHAPTSGTIAAIEDRAIPHPSGRTAPCIVLAPDGREEWVPRQVTVDYRTLPPEALLELIRNAGIVGLGGAGFPSAVKLGARQAIHTLIINGTECEPYITADDILMQERAADILAGVEIMAHILGHPATVLIGVEDNKPLAIEALQAAAKAIDSSVEVVEFPTKYPSGGEKQLIQILTGQEVPSGGLPADLGIVCQNVGTAHAVYRAVAHGEPLISRITTVTGKACTRNGNYKVLLGTPISHLLAHSGFDAKRCTRLVMGGPMMGFTLADDSVPVVKTTNCIIAGSSAEFPAWTPPAQACIRCGLCAEACPASLLPQQLYWYAQAQNVERLEAHNLFDCIECGACAYVCPSNIPLVQYYRGAKSEIRKQEAERQKADHARQRFEFHQARLEKAEAEKAAKREARRLAAEQAQQKVAEAAGAGTAPTANNSAEDLIKAAMAKAAARQASPEQQRAKLERGLEAARNRLALAQTALTDGEAQGLDAEQLDKLRARAEAARLKLAEAERKLADSSGTDIIAKLQQSPREKLEASLATIRKRIATTEQKIAEASDEKTALALQAGLAKQKDKLRSVEQELADLADNPANSSQADPTSPADPAAPEMDAATAAIARAQARADALAAMTPEQKLDATLESLEQRIAKARDKLAQAEASGADHIDALRTALDKLQTKYTGTQRERDQLRQHQEAD